METLLSKEVFETIKTNAFDSKSLHTVDLDIQLHTLSTKVLWDSGQGFMIAKPVRLLCHTSLIILLQRRRIFRVIVLLEDPVATKF